VREEAIPHFRLDPATGDIYEIAPEESSDGDEHGKRNHNKKRLHNFPQLKRTAYNCIDRSLHVSGDKNLTRVDRDQAKDASNVSEPILFQMRQQGCIFFEHWFFILMMRKGICKELHELSRFVIVQTCKRNQLWYTPMAVAKEIPVRADGHILCASESGIAKHGVESSRQQITEWNSQQSYARFLF
jgi:hypothetical protein